MHLSIPKENKGLTLLDMLISLAFICLAGSICFSQLSTLASALRHIQTQKKLLAAKIFARQAATYAMSGGEDLNSALIGLPAEQGETTYIRLDCLPLPGTKTTKYAYYRCGLKREGDTRSPSTIFGVWQDRQ